MSAWAKLLSDPDWAVEEIEWCIAHGARVATMRNGLVYTANGPCSPVSLPWLPGDGTCAMPMPSSAARSYGNSERT